MRILALLTLSLALAAPALASGAPAPAKKPEGSERKITSSPSWISVEPIAVAILRQNRIQGMFLVEFGLDIQDEALRTKADESLPRLRDAWLRNVSDLATTRVRVGRQADLDVLTTRLQTTTDQMLGGPGAKVLLLQAVVREK
jgi:flagellar basal body-associated protein FliL